VSHRWRCQLINSNDIMEHEQRHIDALNETETLMFHSDFCPYLELKELLTDSTALARRRFRLLFTNYYRLNVGGLTDVFVNRFFEILFTPNVIVDGLLVFSAIFNELCSIPRKKGDCATQFSFVSKLVAMHRESSPIYDRHVLAFFVKKAPAKSVPNEDRIAWFVGFLRDVAKDYATWAQDVRVIPIIERLKRRDHRLAQCDVVRQLDFLVWKVGNQKLL
jgi:hypothetical protein